MPYDHVPDDPSVQAMLRWIAKRYHMSTAALARMYQTVPSTISSWLGTGKVSHRSLMKIRSSYYFLHNMRDPHATDRKCGRCGKWYPLSLYQNGGGICPTCKARRGR